MNLHEMADRLDGAADRIGPAVEQRMRGVGSVAVTRIRVNASGRPGPNVITGRYRASWKAVTRPIPHGAQCTVGTDAPQGRRLEFGFVGPDSLGRVYNQPPFPHVQPALPHIADTLRQQMRAAAQEVLA